MDNVLRQPPIWALILPAATPLPLSPINLPLAQVTEDTFYLLLPIKSYQMKSGCTPKR